ncbi:hypothetical protein GYMLUDRAFT_912453 [Collybiopsis luxurians FD-317 M1]|nr:hypothetical protein GYMLUDRAFT_912453 [Collybiopsis luxurians FD-317 M1]
MGQFCNRKQIFNGWGVQVCARYCFSVFDLVLCIVIFFCTTFTMTRSTAVVPLCSLDPILNDITLGKEKPLWCLSSFNPAKYEPTLILGLDLAPEELRVKA